jgi:hypothetical protein
MNSASSRLILAGVLALVGGVSFLASQWPVDFVEHPAEPARWVRTARGWEKAAWLETPSPHDPALHPGILAAILLGASATSLFISHANELRAGRCNAMARPTTANSNRTAHATFAGLDRRRSERRRRDRRISVA